MVSSAHMLNTGKLGSNGLVATGVFLRHLTGNEHPELLHRECVHGDWFSSGKPQALVYEGEVFAILDGNESWCDDVADLLFAVIDTVRARQGRERVFRSPW